MPTWTVDPTQATSLGANRVQTGPELNGLLLAGDTLLWKNGYFHDGNGSNGFIQSYLELDNLTLGTTGTGAKAALDSRIWLAPGSGGWTLVRTTGGVKIYRKLPVANATGAVRRLWVGAINGGIDIGARTVGASKGRPPGTGGGLAYDIEDTYTLADEATVLDRLYAAYQAQGRIWCSLTGTVAADKVLYMIVPSLGASDTPDNWYSGLALLQTGTGTTIGGASPTGIRVRNLVNLTVDGLDISGAAAAFQLDSSTTKASSGITVRNCGLSLWWGRGMDVNGVGSFGASNVLFEDNAVDAQPTEDEQEPLSGKGWFHSSESVEATSNSSSAPLTNFTLRRTTIRGLQHNAINVATGAGSTGIVSGITVEFNTVTANDWETDVRGMAIQGISGAASGNNIRGNVIKNCCTSSEFSGQLTIKGNFWHGHRVSVSEPTIRACVRLGPNGVNAQPTTALSFTHNQVLGCVVTPIRFTAGNENIPAGGITCANNLLQMVGTDETVAFDVRNNVGAFSFSVDGVRILNNHVERATEPTIYWRTTGTGAQIAQAVTAGPSGGTGADRITYTGNTWDTRITAIPSTVYPPSMTAAIFG